MTDAIRQGLLHGAGLSAFMGALIFLSLRQNPLIWLGDAPADVRARLGPIDDRTRRQRRAWGLLMFVGLGVVFGHLAWRTWPLGAMACFVAGFVCFETFNLFDAVVIDLGLVVFRPRWAFPPGAEDSPSYRDPRWHLGNWLKGVVAGLPFAGIVVGLAAAIAGLAARLPPD